MSLRPLLQELAALPPLWEKSAKDVRRTLRKAGCQELRQKGSHVQVQCGNRRSTVAAHGGDIPIGTLKGIEKSLGVDLDGDGDPSPAA